MEAAPQNPTATPTFEPQHDAFRVAIASGDAARVAAMYAPDARLVAPAAAPLHGREAVEGFWRAGIAAGISDIRYDPLERVARAELACEVGRYVLHLQPAEGAPVVERGTYAVVMRRAANGAWLRTLEMLSPLDQQTADGRSDR